MAILSKGATIVADTQVSATNLNNLVDAATFVSGAVDGTTTQISGGAIIVKDGGITPSKLSTGGPSWTSGGALSATGSATITGGAAIGQAAFQVVGNQANQLTANFTTNITTAGQSYGLRVAAGTNASDYAFQVLNQSGGTTYLTVRGDGSVSMSNGLAVTGAVTGNFTGPITGNVIASVASITLLSLVPETGYPTSGTITLNLAAASNAVIELAGNSTFALSGVASGQTSTVALKNNTGGTITTSWPAWTSAGGSFPASLTAGQAMVVSLYSYGTTTASVYAVSSL